MAMTDAQVDELLSAPMVSVIATVNAAGMPAQSPVWHLWRGGAAFVLVSRTSRKWRNLQRNPNVSLCVDTKTAPYRRHRRGRRERGRHRLRQPPARGRSPLPRRESGQGLR